MKLFWLAEGSTRYSLIYAPENYIAGLYISTTSSHEAKKFLTKSECDIWCCDHPVPAYIAVEHGFIEKEDGE